MSFISFPLVGFVCVLKVEKAANHVAGKIRRDDLFKKPVCKMLDDSKKKKKIQIKQHGF